MVSSAPPAERSRRAFLEWRIWLVRPLDPLVKLPERRRTIIVAFEESGNSPCSAGYGNLAD